ncbi:DNA-binding protein YbiB [Polynucleobacter sp. JS-Safj-400b-B2]|uniref:DNA-binding protein YbiB n=1 Tax=Polynucleobacter sp. JS-Safj-400b-B2 TaxID=2576921 RepID=UPI001C0C3634|nr:DNA-binding protein YbiB [Polynucleobacter sp. JS-Safj-400b-B2]MBU3626806.1 DNA-binding protein YbiB [Polynucleobacter sp. JS-Safj-400b-B2]
MSITSFLKVIGRGSKGAGHLDHYQAKEVFTQILDGNVSDLELGAFCIAMRIKGESVSELMGFMDALQPHLNLLNLGTRPTIVLPSYNGARKQANLTPLLAGMLSSYGFTVLVQGVEKDLTRVTSHEIFKSLGWPILETKDEFGALLALNQPIFCPLNVISPALQKLLDIRERIGLRNTGHVLAKLINPTLQKPWQVSNYTHPEYPEKLREFFQLRSANAILMRGSEGEPTASLQRLPEMHFLLPNANEMTTPEERFEDLSPFLEIDAISTASVTEQILSGQVKCPSSILRQAIQISTMAGLH